MHVRELPPLRLHLTAETPSGRLYRWGGDERRAENVPTGTRFSSTAPGGHERLDTTLARKPGVDYGDLERLSTLRAVGAGGAVAWEGRLERAPRTSGDQMAVTPSAVGYLAHLDDDKSAQEVYVDLDLSNWVEAPLERRANHLAVASYGGTPLTTGSGGIQWTPTSGQALVINDSTEVMYMAPAGVTIATMAYIGTRTGTWTNWESPGLQAGPVASLAAGTYAGYALSLTGSIQVQVLTPARYLGLRAMTSAATTPGGGMSQTYSRIAVYGNHGLLTRSIFADAPGLYASDIVTHAVQTWAPLLAVSSDTVQASSFIIPHIAFRELTTASEIVKEATRYGLQDWFVWDGPTFWWHERGAYGRSWRARVGPAQLEETGPAVDRIWESVIVQYQDVDGSTRTVGPPDSGADTEDSALKDSDPENPANQLGIIRRDLLQMGVGTAASATELGRRFLEETKLLDSSGRARIVGHVQDDRGVLHPYWRIRAGDTITFVDSSDTSARRIVRVEHDVDSMTASVDLDAPPDALPALLARLGVVLIPLGL